MSVDRTSEGYLRKEVWKYLQSLKGCWPYKVMDSCMAGLPDFMGCYYGIFFSIELKKEGEVLRTIQEITLNSIVLAGGEACVARQITEVKTFMRRLYARHLERQ